MNPDAIKELLLYSLAFNYAILMLWFARSALPTTGFTASIADGSAFQLKPLTRSTMPAWPSIKSGSSC